jgi:hypothetical protein
MKPPLPVPCKFQQKLPFVATVSQMPNLPGDEMPIRPCHRENSFSFDFKPKN